MNTYQEYCWNSRIVVYVSELPHYIRVPELLLHHLLILMSMGIIARFRGPHRGFDLSLAALWAEIPNSLRYVLSKTHCMRDHPRLDWHLACWTTIIGFLTRAPAVILAMAMIPQSGLQGGPAFIIGSAYFFYLAYIFNLTYRRLKQSDVLQTEGSGVFSLRFGNRLNINSTGLTTGMVVLGIQVSTLAVYNLAKNGASPVRAPELVNITWNLLMMVTIAIVGSQLLAPRLQKFLHWHRLSSVHLKTGILISVATLMFTPTLQRSVDRPTLVGCVLLCSSLGEAVSQLASHLAAVEEGSSDRASLICCIVNLAQFGAAVAAVGTGRSVLETAFKNFLLQLSIRFAVNAQALETRLPKIRPTSGELLMFGILAAFNAMWLLRSSATVVLPHFESNRNETAEADSVASIAPPLQLPDFQKAFGAAAKELILFSFMHTCFHILASWPYRSQSAPMRPSMKDNMKRVLYTTRTITLLCLGIWVCYIICLAFRGEVPEAHNQHRDPHQIVSEEPPLCTLVLSWQFWVSTFASVIISTVATHVWQPSSLSRMETPFPDSFLEPRRPLAYRHTSVASSSGCKGV